MDLLDSYDMAMELMKEHGLLDNGWILIYGTRKCALGICSSKSKQIQLSRPLIEVNSKETVRNTILHEIAHALVGVHHHHDAVWRAKAVEIGCNGDRCSNNAVTVKSNRFLQCPSCKKKTPIYRKHTRDKSCGKCHPGEYNEKYKLVEVWE